MVEVWFSGDGGCACGGGAEVTKAKDDLRVTADGEAMRVFGGVGGDDFSMVEMRGISGGC